MKPTLPDFQAKSQMLATKLRTLRERAALTQADLAQASGVSRSMIQKIEQGIQLGSRSTHRRLAAALNISVTMLLSYEPLLPEDATILEAQNLATTNLNLGEIAQAQAQAADIQQFATWLAARQPTRLDLARIRKLVQVYFRED